MIFLLNAVLALPSKRGGGTYQLVDNWRGENFFSGFDFFTGRDPTKGFVTYVDEGHAKNDGLVGITPGGGVYMGVDYTNTLDPNGAGRKSIRIETKKAYDEGLFIVDLKHMPGNACGVWPAFWTVGPSWPGDGEIDIIEAVNLITSSQITLHTGGSCLVSGSPMMGSLVTTECGEVAGTQGCVVNAGGGTFGSPFNVGGGGVYAMEWTADHIAIWSFDRGAIPASIVNDQPDVSTFGTPRAYFKGDCNFADHFRAQRLVFDTTFCGDWAGGVYGESGCPMTGDSKQSCHNYVAANPSAYKESYWEVDYVKIYQGGEKTSGISVGSSSANIAGHTPAHAASSSFAVGVAKRSSAIAQAQTQTQGPARSLSTFAGQPRIAPVASPIANRPVGGNSAAAQTLPEILTVINTIDVAPSGVAAEFTSILAETTGPGDVAATSVQNPAAQPPNTEIQITVVATPTNPAQNPELAQSTIAAAAQTSISDEITQTVTGYDPSPSSNSPSTQIVIVTAKNPFDSSFMAIAPVNGAASVLPAFVDDGGPAGGPDGSPDPATNPQAARASAVALTNTPAGGDPGPSGSAAGSANQPANPSAVAPAIAPAGDPPAGPQTTAASAQPPAGGGAANSPAIPPVGLANPPAGNPPPGQGILPAGSANSSATLPPNTTQPAGGATSIAPGAGPTASPSLPVVVPAPAPSTVPPSPSVPSPAASQPSIAPGPPPSPHPVPPIITGGHSTSVPVIPPAPGTNTAAPTIETSVSPTEPAASPPLFTGGGSKLSFYAKSIIAAAVVALLNSRLCPGFSFC